MASCQVLWGMNFLQWGITVLVTSRNSLWSGSASSGGIAAATPICALLGWWQSPALSPWDPPSLPWVSLLAPAAQQGLAWGNRNQIPSVCTQRQLPGLDRSLGRAQGCPPPSSCIPELPKRVPPHPQSSGSAAGGWQSSSAVPWGTGCV